VEDERLWPWIDAALLAACPWCGGSLGPTPAAFAWTDPRRLFDAYGFAVVGNPDGGKQRVRKRIV
jgi:hypothetical protein